MPPFPFAASDEINRILYATADPTVEIDGQPIPALTTLLLGVCGNDPVKFTEATRLVRLFISMAMASTTQERLRHALRLIENECREPLPTTLDGPLRRNGRVCAIAQRALDKDAE